MATGHLGMCTIHAESVDAMIHRLESEPMNIPRTLLTTLDLIAVQRRVVFRDRVLRRIVTLTEIVGIDPATRELITNEVYRWNPVNDVFERLRRSYRLEEIVKIRGMTMEEAEMEIERRKEILEWMVKNNIRHYEQVNKIIRDYYANPDRLYKRIKVGVT
jgi:flagellar protein FlaI